MSAADQVIKDLESRRRALNERLMNSKSTQEANGIERELWAVRAAIRYYKSADAGKNSLRKSGLGQPGQSSSSFR